MEDFNKLFIDEANDLLITLEESLLHLENDTTNKELINEVFRVMHSLKGSGAMFGFTNLSTFTHNLENLYDNIRNDITPITEEIITFTINSIDHIKTLLNNDIDDTIANQTKELELYISRFTANNITRNENHIAEKDNKNISTNSETKKVYYINFNPNKDILNDGTNPIYLIDELVDLGEAIVQINHESITDLVSTDPQKCYFSWTILLSTMSDVSEIEDVFIFVEDDSDLLIKILSEDDLFEIPNAISTFRYLLETNSKNYDKFTEIAISLKESYDPKNDNILLTTNENTKDIECKIPSKKSPKIPSSLNIDNVKVSSVKLDNLINLVSELVTTQARLQTISENLKNNELTSLSEDFLVLSRQFRDTAFDMRLIPVSNMLVKFKRLVRDLSINLNKKVNFVTEGTDVEVDKNILATISDPVMHIIRNAIDHGIELPEVRISNNKNETGTLIFKAFSSGTSIIFTIEDDGQGINTKSVKKKAIEKNIITSTESLSEEEITNLLMQPGFSTNDEVTDISGRGVGMDVVRKKINELSGKVNINSKEGLGTKITITLPLTLSIIDGLLISINKNKYIIPISTINRIQSLSYNEYKNATKGMVEIEGKYTATINLVEKFGGKLNNDDILHIIVVLHNNNKIGLVINQLISEYQAVLKPIDKLLNNTELFSGATILGNGKVALVLDPNKIINFYSKQNNYTNDQ